MQTREGTSHDDWRGREEEDPESRPRMMSFEDIQRWFPKDNDETEETT
jgi:hypothetical protein